MVEMVCQEETVWMEREDHKENRDQLDLKEMKDLGVLESLTSGGERAPALALLELNWSMLGELVELATTTKEEEQRNYVCLSILTTLTILDQLVQPFSPLYTEQNIKLSMVRITTYIITMFPALSAMPPPEQQ